MLRVLYVDDEPALLEIGRLFLERTHEITALTAVSAKDALLLMKENPVDVIISDYEMPEMNGIGFLKAVRESGNEIPFIIFTGRGREEVVIQALNAGADFYIQKGGEPKSQFADLINKVHHAVHRRVAEKELKQKIREWNGIFQGIAQSAIVLDADLRIITANKATYDLFGLPEGELEGQHYSQVFPPDEKMGTPGPVERVLISRKHETHEIFHSKLNKTFLVSCTPVLSDSGEIERIIHLSTDITDHKKAEEEKSRLLLFQQEMLETSAVWIETEDPQGNITFWNRGAETISGYRREEVLGNSDIRTLLYPDPQVRADAHRQAEQALSDRDRIREYETRIVSRSGDTKVISWYSHILAGSDGTVSGRIAIGTDSTIRRNAETELSFKNDELLTANEELLAAAEELRDHNTRFQQQQEALAVSTERLSLALDSSEEGLWDWNLHSGDVYVSPKVYSLLGQDPVFDLFDKNTWKALVHQEDCPQVKEALSRYMNHKDDRFMAEFRVRHSDQSWRWLLSRGKAVRYDENGQMIRIVGTIRDITSQKEITEDVLSHDEIFHDVNLPLMIVHQRRPDDPSFSLVRTNPASCAILGPHPDLFIGMPLDEIQPCGIDRREWKDLCDHLISGSYQSIHPSGVSHLQDSQATYEIRILPLRGERFLLIFEQKIPGISKEPDAESAATYRELIESSADMIFLICDDEICFKNCRFIRYLQEYGVETDIRSVMELVYPDDRDLVFRYMTDHARSHSIPGKCEFRIRLPKGIVRWIEITTTSFSWEGKRALLTFASDITDRVLDLQALEQANRKLNLLTSITRHDILNQLTALNGFLDLAEEGEGDMHRNLFRIRAASEIIRTQIEYTRMYNELGSVRPGWYFLGDIIREQIPAFESSGIVIETVPEELWLYADPMIGKVFYNLIDNAVRYGEKITRIRFSWVERGDTLVIICEDDGAGIADEMKQKIFLRGVGKNTGFGLFLAREILSITGMTIEETGTAGSGARFEITLPPGGFRIMGSVHDHHSLS